MGCAASRMAALDWCARDVVRARTEPGVSTNDLTDAFVQLDLAPVLDHVYLDPAGSLRLAIRHSHELQNKRDKLVIKALDLLARQRDFGLQSAASLQALHGLTGAEQDQDNIDAALSLGSKLFSGGDWRLEGTSAGTRHSVTNSDWSYSSALNVTVNQPLLAGVGYENAYSELIQAEHDLVYALRAFVLERQDFAIDILKDFYALVNQRQVLENTLKNNEQSQYLYERSEALFKVRRAASIDVLRAKQQQLSAGNRVATTRMEYEIQVARFLDTLGLAMDVEVAIDRAVPALNSMSLDERAAMQQALGSRLDLRTEQDRAHDAERVLRVARNALLPDLDGFGKVRVAGQPGETVGGEDFEESASVGIKLDLPLDRRKQRIAVRKAELSLSEAQRRLTRKRNQVRIEVLESYRRLKALVGTVDIERQNVDIAQKRAENATVRFKSGEYSNRDVVDAENELLAARNAYTKALVDHEVQRLRLLRNIGQLDLTVGGLLIEWPAVRGRSNQEDSP